MVRVLLVLIGYVFGLFQTGYLYGKLVNRDLRKEGSGNTGATNALRVMGWKAALIVFFFDALKAFIPVFAVKMIFKDDPYRYVYAMYTALGVILGNDFPFYLKFKGGKGVAATAGWGLAINAPYALICIGIFFLVSVITRYVSVGTLTVCVFIVGLFMLWVFKGWIPIPFIPARIETFVLVILLEILMVWRHKDNIKRLIRGEENRFGKKK